MCQSNFSSRKSCLRAFVSVKFGYFKWPFSTKSLRTKKTKALKMGFLVWKLFWNKVNKVNIIKNGYSKKNFSDPKSVVMTKSPNKRPVFLQGHEDQKIVPIFFGSLHHNRLLKSDFGIVYWLDDKIPIIGGVRLIFYCLLYTSDAADE